MLYWGWVIWWQRWRVVPATDRWWVMYIQQSLLGMTVQNFLLLLTVQICIMHCDCILKSNFTNPFTAFWVFCLTFYFYAFIFPCCGVFHEDLAVFQLKNYLGRVWTLQSEHSQNTWQVLLCRQAFLYCVLFCRQSFLYSILLCRVFSVQHLALQTVFSVQYLAFHTSFSVLCLALRTCFSVWYLALQTGFLYSVAISQVPSLSGLVPCSKLCCTCCGPVKYCGTAVPQSDWRKKQQQTSVGT